MTPRLFVLVGALSSLGAAPANSPTDVSLERAVEYLMAAQGEDGGWHSETYGAMRPGAAVTATVLYAMSHVPEPLRERHRERLVRAYAFLETGMRQKGYVANPDGSADFPTYASAMTLVAARRLGFDMSAKDERRLVKYLISAQLTETREFGPDSPHHGGWDLMGAQQIQGQTSGTNVSVSRFALEALSDRKEPEVRCALERAGRWVGGCQNVPGDGGFYFTPDVNSDNNKAETAEDKNQSGVKYPRSYGTTTCDGLMCLIYSGTDPQDERVTAAVQWLIKHPQINVVPGFEDLPDEIGWQNGLLFYYYAAFAEALHLLPEKEAAKRRDPLTARILSLQRADGRWQNDSARMREDDPLICTSLAIMALGELRPRE